jgi:predicted acetyltransferase
MAVCIREATEADVERLVEIHTFAFPDSRGHDARVRNFRAKPLGGLSRLRVAYDTDLGGRLVGHAFLLDLRVFVEGRPVRMGGIATVGVEGAHRGRGVATTLLTELHAEAARSGMALTMLYAFRQGFYARLGYSSVTPTQRLELVPASLPAIKPPGTLRVRHAGEGDRAVLCAAHERACTFATGMIARPAARWDELLADERLAYVLAVDADGAAHGGMAYRLHQSAAHGKVVLEIEDLFVENPLARAALLDHVRSLRDQVAEVHVSLAWDDPLAPLLIDADANRFGDATVEHAIGRVCAGPMTRLVSLRWLLLARGYQEDGELVLAVSGNGESECLALRVKDGQPSVTVEDAERADVVLTSNAGAVLAGGVRLRDAVRLGFARVRPAILGAADRLLATSSFLSYDGF